MIEPRTTLMNINISTAKFGLNFLRINEMLANEKTRKNIYLTGVLGDWIAIILNLPPVTLQLGFLF